MTTQANITLAAFNVNQTLTVTLPPQITTLINAIADQDSISNSKKLNPNILAQLNILSQQIATAAASIGVIAGASAV
jgi:hypothetical protein